jgi:hypothetical protein
VPPTRALAPAPRTLAPDPSAHAPASSAPPRHRLAQPGPLPRQRIRRFICRGRNSGSLSAAAGSHNRNSCRTSRSARRRMPCPCHSCCCRRPDGLLEWGLRPSAYARLLPILSRGGGCLR